MKKLNALAIKTFDKLLALSDEELKAKFDALNSSDLSDILSHSGMFESAKVEADIVYGLASTYDHTLNESSMAAAFITQVEEVEEICTEAIKDLTYTPILSELWLTPTFNMPALNLPSLHFSTINVSNELTASQVLKCSTIWNTNFDGLWNMDKIQMQAYASSNSFEVLNLALEPVTPNHKKAA